MMLKKQFSIFVLLVLFSGCELGRAENDKTLKEQVKALKKENELLKKNRANEHPYKSVAAPNVKKIPSKQNIPMKEREAQRKARELRKQAREILEHHRDPLIRDRRLFEERQLREIEQQLIEGKIRPLAPIK